MVPSKFRQRCLLWLIFVILGLLISLFPYRGIGVLAIAKEQPIVITSENAPELETQGRQYYSAADYNRAIAIWQQARDIYRKTEDTLGQGRVLSNLALAYGQLNNWQQATENISISLELLTQGGSILPGDKAAGLAQIYNNQGILLLNQGKIEDAIAAWSEAKVNYQQAEDSLGIIRASINQANGYKQLGLYRRAVNTLDKVEQDLVLQPDSPVGVTGLRSYGEMLRLVGEVKRSRVILQASLEMAENLQDSKEEVKTLIALGNTYKVNDPQQAVKVYARSREICQNTPECLESDLSLQLDLAEFNLLIDTPQWQDSQKLIQSIQQGLAGLPLSRVNIDRKINFAHNLLELRAKHSGVEPNNIPSLASIEIFLRDTIQEAKTLNYPQAKSYIWGLQGQIQEKTHHWQEAEKYTRQALIAGQKLNAPEIVYLWQWQMGRILQAQGNRSQAIAHYSRAVELLKSLSQDLAAIDPNVQYSFQEEVEPVYRELVSLLLSSDTGEEIGQSNLEGAREVIESLRLAELNNFFREACLDARVVDIDSVDPDAAIIYPIILDDRLEVILSLPNQPLQHYSTSINREKLEGIIEQFRQSVVVRSRRNFYRPATQLYDILIRPELPGLVSNQVKTLVFIPDGVLRNIPLGALYDGQQYLVENYAVALTPGLQLLSPRPLQQIELKTIAAGLTEGRQGFSALNHVDEELQEIKTKAEGDILLNQKFTTESLKEKIRFSDYPIVHIATHGQFSSSLEDTFLLTWDNLLNINQLESILQTRNLQQNRAIELLVLSACETATGDKRAALGLAGMAVRAGAKSTLATLWSVNDLATTRLMKDFYQELADKHLPKAEAVRQAQLSLLHSRGYEHPFYWASYVLLGNWL